MANTQDNITTNRNVLIAAWAISTVATLIAIIAWGQGVRWHISTLSTYAIFPLLGLLAFSLMWSHYIAAVMRLSSGVNKVVLHTYFEVTSFVVLVAILLHPGLLAWQLWRDGLGLPPLSALHYVAPAFRWAILFAETSLLLFLAYELRRIFDKKPWWKYFGYATDLAMILIFFHSLRLGSQLQHGWLRDVWYFYGVTLLGSLIYIHGQKFFSPKKAEEYPHAR